MKFAVVVFPGSNCDEDAFHAASSVLGERATQQQIDEKVLQVRKLPWSEIVHD